MEALVVISKVTESSIWCAGMVVITKRSGDLRICMDLKALNESVMHEVYPIPRVNETLAQLTGATFSGQLSHGTENHHIFQSMA